MKELRKVDAYGYNPSQLSLIDFAQDPFSKCQGMEGTIITRSSLMVTKLPYNMTCRVVRAMTEPNQRTQLSLKLRLTVPKICN